MNSRALVGSTFALASLVACSQPAPPPPAPDAAAIRAGIEKTYAKFTDVLKAKDAAGTVTFFTPDATWILPDASTFTGTDAITKGATAFLASVDTFAPDVPVIDKIIVVSDSEAVVFAHGMAMMKMKGGKKVERHNNPFADDLKKAADGSWKVAYEVNADGVVPEKKP